MADPSKSEQEPSIEEILSSIRQIISDDDDDDSGDAPEEEAMIEPDPVEEEEAIDLTERADPQPEEEPVEEPEPEEEIVIDMQEPEEDILDGPLDDENDDTPEVPFSEAGDDSLLTKRAEDAAYGAFKKLAAKTAIDSMSGITIEEIVRDELRPMLRSWLDQNLPLLVERILKDELDKIARRALDE